MYKSGNFCSNKRQQKFNQTLYNASCVMRLTSWSVSTVITLLKLSCLLDTSIHVVATLAVVKCSSLAIPDFIEKSTFWLNNFYQILLCPASHVLACTSFSSLRDPLIARLLYLPPKRNKTRLFWETIDFIGCNLHCPALTPSAFQIQFQVSSRCNSWSRT